ncbi:MAG: phosphatidate cytidylyltransferase [Bacteroidia bacterium]|nr:phosphatidate cytidylyltransferase [Bacteroidia bacterium]
MDTVHPTAPQPGRSKPRTLTALGVAAGILGIWWAGDPFIRLFLAVLAGGCCWEIYLRLQPGHPEHPRRAAYGAALLGLLAVGIGPAGDLLPGIPADGPAVAVVALAFVPGWWLLKSNYMHRRQHPLAQSVLRWASVVAYVVAPLLLFRNICLDPRPVLGGLRGPDAFMACFGLLWILDSGALLVGKRWGRRPLHRRISPSKTLEGSLAGWLFCALAGWFLYPFLFGIRAADGWGWVALGAGPVGIAGDLMESALKRKAGVKDSGHWLPGHGGWLDRFDSLLALAVWVGLWKWALA